MTRSKHDDAPQVAGAQPLSGVKILEQCSLVCGPFCTKILAALGADVIKIEPPNGGDAARRWGPFPQDIPHAERSGLFILMNTNKRGITLDPTTSDGAAILHHLIQDWADVFVVEKPPSSAEQSGLSYEALIRSTPRLIVTSISPFGETGPKKDYKAYPLQASHASGSAYLQPSGRPYVRHPELPPVTWGGLVGECSVGRHAALATMAALFVQRIAGTGQHVEISKQEALIHSSRYSIGGYPISGVAERREALNDRRSRPVTKSMALSGTTSTQDGYVTVWPLTPEAPDALIQWLGNPEWSQDERFRDLKQWEDADEAWERLQGELKSYTSQELYHSLQGVGVPVSPIYNAPEVLADPQLQARGFFERVEHPDGGAVPLSRLPFKLLGWEQPPQRSAPRLGQHNGEVYCNMLGYSRADLVRLYRAGVI